MNELTETVEAHGGRDTRPVMKPLVLLNKNYCFNILLTETDTFPTPSIQEILDQLHGASIFSTLDLKSEYWQIPLKEKSREYSVYAQMETISVLSYPI